MKPAEGSSYTEVLQDLKRKIRPDSLGVTIKGVRETRSEEVLVELGPTADGRSKLSAAIKNVVDEGGSVRELVPRTEVEVFELDTITDAKDVEAAVRSHFGEKPASEIKVSLTKKTFRGILKTFVELSEEMTVKLVRAGHLKVGWVSYRVRQKTEVMEVMFGRQRR